MKLIGLEWNRSLKPSESVIKDLVLTRISSFSLVYFTFDIKYSIKRELYIFIFFKIYQNFGNHFVLECLERSNERMSADFINQRAYLSRNQTLLNVCRKRSGISS